MRSETACLVIFLAGCGETAPPLDELPLRDALRADPEVVAAMPEEARQRLGSRLEAARAGDDASEPVDGPAEDPYALIAQVDAARARRASEPLIVGEIAGGLARAVRGSPVSDAAAPPLPPLEASPPTSITPLEPRALEGDAGRWLRALFAASGAHHLRRVVGWPAGAVAVGDTVYVNAAWLAALAPAAPAADAGSDAASSATPAGNPAGGPLPSGTRATPAVAEDSAPSPSPAFPDAGVYLPPPPQPPPPPAPPPVDTTGDSCAAAGDGCSGCAGASDGSDDACNSTTDDGSGDACNSTTNDGSDTNCQISRGRRNGGAGRSTTLTLVAPLAFLLTRKRR